MTAVQISRAEIVSILRSRGKLARADWVERQLPEIFDLGRNRSLLATLEIDPDGLSRIDRVPQHA